MIHMKDWCFDCSMNGPRLIEFYGHFIDLAMSALNALHRIYKQDRRRRKMCRVTGGEGGGEAGGASGGFPFDFEGNVPRG